MIMNIQASKKQRKHLLKVLEDHVLGEKEKIKHAEEYHG